MILDNSLTIVGNHTVSSIMHLYNMHEFNPINGGESALFITIRTIPMDLTGLVNETKEDPSGLVQDLGFSEVILATGDTRFEWWAADHIPLSMSSRPTGDLQGPWPNGWNWM